MLPGLTAAAFPMPALTVPAIDTIGVPSECLLLKNMFDPSLEVCKGEFYILATSFSKYVFILKFLDLTLINVADRAGF